jgi:hypothetical protein
VVCCLCAFASQCTLYLQAETLMMNTYVYNYTSAVNLNASSILSVAFARLLYATFEYLLSTAAGLAVVGVAAVLLRCTAVMTLLVRCCVITSTTQKAQSVRKSYQCECMYK